jgi:hypothetical protein
MVAGEMTQHSHMHIQIGVTAAILNSGGCFATERKGFSMFHVGTELFCSKS